MAAHWHLSSAPPKKSVGESICPAPCGGAFQETAGAPFALEGPDRSSLHRAGCSVPVPVRYDPGTVLTHFQIEALRLRIQSRDAAAARGETEAMLMLIVQRIALDVLAERTRPR